MKKKSDSCIENAEFGPNDFAAVSGGRPTRNNMAERYLEHRNFV
jgi:hypothetical protein